jgi:hypothetical protein
MRDVWDNLFAATIRLASCGNVKQRLTDAYLDYLAGINSDDFPKELRDDFTTLVKALSCVKPLHGENAVHATVRKMSDREAGHCAARIVNLLGTMTRLQSQPRQPMLRAVGASGE